MATHVALLRGINVGGNNKVPMADLREVVASLGHTGVSTYIQSGNVLFTARAGAPADAPALAAGLEKAIEQAFGLELRVVVLSRAELAQVISDNPYRAEPNPKYVHVMFFPAEPGRRCGSPSRRRSGRPRRRAAGTRPRWWAAPCSCTPRTATAAASWRPGWPGPAARRTTGTARNMATVTKLLALCDA